jgi:hypothetical protein
MSDKFPSNASGFDANDTPHLFDAIRLVVVNGQQGREIMLHRPTITSIAFGDIEHSANEVNTFQVEFDYENFTVGKVIEKPLDEIDLAKFSIYGKDSGTSGIAKNEKYDPLDAEAPYRQKVGQEIPAAGLLDAGRRSQPQLQPQKEKKINDPNQQRDKRGRAI